MTTDSFSFSSRRSFLSNLIAGGAVGVLMAIISVSYGSLIFSAELSDSLSQGTGLLLFSFFVIATIVASLSSYPAIVASPQDTTMPILALVARHIVEVLPHSATPEERFYTVVAMLILNSLMVGSLFVALGRFKLGELIRFIPYPVVGGFLAGMGVLLIQGVLHSLNGIDTHHFKLTELFYLDVLLQWLPGLLFALLLFGVLRYFGKFWVIPVILIGTISLFYIGLAIAGISLPEAHTRGLMLGHFESTSLYQFITIPALTQANWPVIFKQIPDLAALWLVDTIALLFSASGIEMMTGRDLNLNHELKAAGIASLVSGLGGGVSGFPTLGETSIAQHFGGTRRLVGWTIATCCLFMLIAGGGLLSFMPKLIPVGVSFFLGLELLYDWLYKSWFKFSPIDFAIIVLIVLTIATVGYLPGIGVGLLAAIILFVIDFSHVSVIKHELSGAQHRSHVGRSVQQIRLLSDKGNQIYILTLQGFIFFGTANKLLDRIKQVLDQASHPIQFLLLDFRQVIGLDSSAVLSFTKLTQLATQSNLRLVLTHLTPTMHKLLQPAMNSGQSDGVCQCFPDLDRGLEWCEAQIIDASSWRRSRFMPLPLLLKSLFPDPKQVTAFMPYLEKYQVAAGENLFHQADPPFALYFIETGQISTFITTDSGKTLRLQTLGPGTVVGEIEFFRQTPHPQAAIAEQPTTLYRLTSDRLRAMIQESPQTAAVFQEFMLAQMAERLSQTTEEIRRCIMEV